MEKNEWYRIGIDNGWVKEYCATHDYFLTDAELDIETQDGEVCAPILRFVHDE